jgi:nucleoside-diphosphate-sugar epimerase
MNILITGGNGEVGQTIVSSFSNKGNNICVIDRHINNLSSLHANNVELIQDNIKDISLIKKHIKNKDIVVHLAWTFSKDPKEIFETDIVGTINILKTCVEENIRHFLYTSTATVYGTPIKHPIEEDHPCLINESRNPLYSLGKYTAEQLSLLYNKDNKLPITIFRFWWAFGNIIGGKNLKSLIKKALLNEPIELVQDAGGTFITTEDLAYAMELAIHNKNSHGKIYNIGSIFLTWEEITKIIIEQTGSSSYIRFLPLHEWKGSQFLRERWDIDYEKITSELGYKTQFTESELKNRFKKALYSCISQVKEELQNKKN